MSRYRELWLRMEMLDRRLACARRSGRNRLEDELAIEAASQELNSLIDHAIEAYGLYGLEAFGEVAPNPDVVRTVRKRDQT